MDLKNFKKKKRNLKIIKFEILKFENFDVENLIFKK